LGDVAGEAAAAAAAAAALLANKSLKNFVFLAIWALGSTTNGVREPGAAGTNEGNQKPGGSMVGLRVGGGAGKVRLRESRSSLRAGEARAKRIEEAGIGEPWEFIGPRRFSRRASTRAAFLSLGSAGTGRMFDGIQ